MMVGHRIMTQVLETGVMDPIPRSLAPGQDMALQETGTTEMGSMLEVS